MKQCAHRKIDADDRVLLHKITLRTIELTAKVSTYYACSRFSSIGRVFFLFAVPFELLFVKFAVISLHLACLSLRYLVHYVVILFHGNERFTDHIIIIGRLIKFAHGAKAPTIERNFFSQFTFDRHFKSSVNSIRSICLWFFSYSLSLSYACCYNSCFLSFFLFHNIKSQN